MLQDYTSTQTSFRRFMPTPQVVMESTSHPGHPPMSIVPQVGRAV